MKIPFVSSLLDKLRSGKRPPFEWLYGTLLVLFLAYMAGDLIILYTRPYLLPTSIPAKRMAPAPRMARSYNYGDVLEKNIFNADHKIPPSLGELQGGNPEDNVPRKSELPLDLLGTIVHANPAKSVATIIMKGQNKVDSYMVGQNIESMAEVKEIQRERVIFRNSRTQVLEYIEVPQDQKLVLSTEKVGSRADNTPEEKTNFTFPRAQLEAELNDLPKLLQQARAIPEAGPDGQIRGFKIVEIQPGSIFDRIGIRIGDTILSVNGEPITSPQKAMDLFKELRTANELKLGLDRNGSDKTINYQIQ
jgi:general secretion pathway protein C